MLFKRLDPRAWVGAFTRDILLGAFIFSFFFTGVLLSRAVVSGEPWQQFTTLNNLEYIFVISCIVVGLVLFMQPAWGRSYVAFLATVFIIFGVFNAIDMTLLRWLNQPTVAVLQSLPEIQQAAFPAFFIQHISPFFIVVGLLFTLPAFLTMHLVSRYNHHPKISAALLILISLLGFPTLWYSYTPKIETKLFSPVEMAALKIDPGMNMRPLERADRSDSLRLGGPARAKPRTIVIVINESTSFFNPTSSGGNTSLIDRLVALGGGGNNWNVYKNAVTNSSCTDVSHPSLLTGTGTYERFDKLHRMPFVFDLAKASGYRTIFYTSQLVWANLTRFFSGAKLDNYLDASMTGQPLINDLGIDDIFIVEKLKELVHQLKNEHLFIVLGTNAMHSPFQDTSALQFPPNMKDRRLRALFVLEATHKMLFDMLREEGRFDDALIMITADHGEHMGWSTDSRTVNRWASGPRLENYDKDILQIPFLIKEPASLPEEMANGLRANADALVTNLDIAPTIAEMLNVGLNNNLEYVGYSLFRKIPASRLSVAVSTNSWRSWPRTAVALARKQDRLMCNSQVLCVYHNISEAEDKAMTPSEREKNRLLYMEQATKIPVVNQNISKIYHDALQTAWSPPSELVVEPTSLYSSLVGGVLRDAVDDMIVRAPEGHPPGNIVYGPYRTLPSGSYKGQMTLELGAGGQEGERLCRMEVYDGKDVLGQEDILAGPPDHIRHVAIPFAAPDISARRQYELRLWCSGKVAVTVKKVAIVH